MIASQISEKEVLSLFLSSGNGDSKALILSDALLKRFGNIYAISNASFEELLSVKGIGQKKAKMLKTIALLLEQYLGSKIMREDTKCSMKELVNYFILTMRHLKFEMFSFASMDLHRRLIGVENMFRGSIQSTTIYPREIVQKLLNIGASYIVFAHNHPSGDTTPSEEDIELTKALFNLCKSVNIKVVDHYIIGANSKFSFRREGLIDNFKDNIYHQFGEEYA